MSVVVGIDIGGSTTKIVGIRVAEDGSRTLIKPQNVKATDPLTAVYGAFGKFTDENRLEIKDISRVMMTGVGSSYVKRNLYGLDCMRASEFESIGKGGLYLSGLREALVVSMGTGTAMVHAKGDKMSYLGGTGVGGGTLMGLSKLLLKAENIDHIAEYADGGDLANIDLRIRDITAKEAMSDLAADMTAANFGNVSDVATKSDIARGIMNMVFETVAMVSVFAARSVGVKDVVLTGNVTVLEQCRAKFKEIGEMNYGVNFIIPEYSRYATVIGAALRGVEEESL
ncbi:MAG: type II pantothenate kinase [Clostridia bacterium]|nr:type II pantothenate kinase [Clostridia bacterium]